MNWMNNTWSIFHKISLKTNINFDKEYNIFFESFKKIIPCYSCRKHYIEQTKNIYFLHNIWNNNLFELTVDLHNNVNELKKIEKWNYEKAKKYYNNYILKKEEIIYFIEFYSNTITNTNIHEIIKMLKSFVHLIPIKNIRKQLIYYEYLNPLNAENKETWLKNVKNLINKHYK